MAAEILVAESLVLKILTWLESRELVINNQRRESFKSLKPNLLERIIGQVQQVFSYYFSTYSPPELKICHTVGLTLDPTDMEPFIV